MTKVKNELSKMGGKLTWQFGNTNRNLSFPALSKNKKSAQSIFIKTRHKDGQFLTYQKIQFRVKFTHSWGYSSSSMYVANLIFL